MAQATQGSVVALAKGTYSEGILVKAGVTVWGACVAQTQLRASATAGSAVSVSGLNAQLRNVRVTGPRVGVLVNPSGRSLALVDVIVDGAVGVGLVVGNTASVTGHDVVIRNTVVDGAGRGGRAMTVEYGGVVTLEKVVLDNNVENGVHVAEPGSQVSLADVRISNTQMRQGIMGRAASVNKQARLVLARAVLEDNHEGALLVGGGSELKMTDVVVRGTRAISSKEAGHGMTLEAASAELNRCVFSRNQAIGIHARSAATLIASDLVVLDTQFEEGTGRDGIGVDVIENSRLTLQRAYLDRNHTVGVSVSYSTAFLDDVDIRGTRPSALQDAPIYGLQIAHSVVDVHRVRVSRNEYLGVLVFGPSTRLTGTDLTIADIHFSSRHPSSGSGLAVQNGAKLMLDRLAIRRVYSAGIQAADLNTEFSGEDFEVSDVQNDPQGRYGRGIHLQDEARVNLKRAVVQRMADVGILVGLGSRAELSDLIVRDITRPTCATEGRCPDNSGSAVVVAHTNAGLTASRFAVARSEKCGLLLSENGVADLSVGDVSHHPVGACVATQGFDVARISKDVSYRDNGRKLEAQTVPLPEMDLPRPPEWKPKL